MRTLFRRLLGPTDLLQGNLLEHCLQHVEKGGFARRIGQVDPRHIPRKGKSRVGDADQIAMAAGRDLKRQFRMEQTTTFHSLFLLHVPSPLSLRILRHNRAASTAREG
jgi:hypothetical protein